MPQHGPPHVPDAWPRPRLVALAGDRPGPEDGGPEPADEGPGPAFWEEQDPWLAALVLLSLWDGEAGVEALSRALNGERCGLPAAVDFWLEVHGCVRFLASL